MKREIKIRFHSITVDTLAKLKVEGLAKEFDRSESWITERAIDKLSKEDCK